MRKGLIATAIAVALFAVGAFAASFNVESEDIASGSDAVTACAELVDIDFGNPVPNAGGEFVVSTAVVKFYDEVEGAPSPTDGCEGYRAKLALVVGGLAAEYGGEVVVPTDATSITFSFSPILVENITNASVVVDGKTLHVES